MGNCLRNRLKPNLESNIYKTNEENIYNWLQTKLNIKTDSLTPLQLNSIYLMKTHTGIDKHEFIEYIKRLIDKLCVKPNNILTITTTNTKINSNTNILLTTPSSDTLTSERIKTPEPKHLSLSHDLSVDNSLNVSPNTVIPNLIKTKSISNVSEVEYKFITENRIGDIYYYSFLACIKNGFDYFPVIDWIINNEPDCVNDIVIKSIIWGNTIVFKNYISLINPDINNILLYLCLQYNRFEYLEYIHELTRNLESNEFILSLQNIIAIYLKQPIIKRARNKSFSFRREDIYESVKTVNFIKTGKHIDDQLFKYIKDFNIDCNYIILLYKNCHIECFKNILIHSLDKIINNYFVSSLNIDEYNWNKLFSEKNLILFVMLNEKLNFRDFLTISGKINMINKFLIYNTFKSNIGLFIKLLNPDISILSNSLLIFNTNLNIVNYLEIFNIYSNSNKLVNLCYMLGKKINISINNIPILFLKNYKKTINIKDYEDMYFENNIELLKKILKELFY